MTEHDFDPLAFWLFPDWTGTESTRRRFEKPFWMNEPLAPAKPPPARDSYVVDDWHETMLSRFGRQIDDLGVSYSGAPMIDGRCPPGDHDLVRVTGIGVADYWRCVRCPHREPVKLREWQTLPCGCPIKTMIVRGRAGYDRTSQCVACGAYWAPRSDDSTGRTLAQGEKVRHPAKDEPVRLPPAMPGRYICDPD